MDSYVKMSYLFVKTSQVLAFFNFQQESSYVQALMTLYVDF